MTRNLGIFILCGILFWGCQPPERDSVSKENVQPDSVKASGSSYSVEEKISQNLAKLHNGATLEQDSLLSIRLELVEQLNEKEDRELAKMHLDTLERALIQRKDSQSIFFVQTANLLGSYYFRNRNSQEALAYYQAASRANDKLPSSDTAALVKSLVNAGVILDQLDQYQAAYEAYTQSLPLAEAMGDTTNDRLARIYNNIGNVLLHQQKPFRAEGWFEKSANWLNRYFPPDHGYTYRTYLYQGDVLAQLGRPNEAIQLYEKVIEYSKSQGDNRQLADTHVRVGRALNKKEDFEAALDYYKESIRYYEALPPHDFYRNIIAGIYMSMGNAMRVNHQLDEAHLAMEKADSLYRQILPETHPSMAILNMNWAIVYYNQNRLAEAEVLLNKAYQGYVQNHGPESPYLITLYYAMGSLYEKQIEWAKADQQYQEALSIARKNYGNRHSYTALTLANLADLYLKQAKYEESLAYIQQAINCLFPEVSAEAIYEVPELNSSVSSANYAIDILWAKANILYEFGIKESDLLALETSFKTFLSAIQLNEKVWSALSTGSSKLTLQQDSYLMYEGAIRTSWALYEHTEDENYLQEAFYISERSKANLLMEALRESEAQQFAGIDPDLLVWEAQIQSELNDLDKRLFDVRQGETKVEKTTIAEWESKQFALKQSFDSLKKSLETDHPEYFRLKYNNEVSNLEEIQKKIPNETTLLEYFVGDSNLYMFVISREGYHAIKQPVNPDLITQINDVREGIYQWYFDPNTTEKEMQIYLGRYQKKASDLYASLIAPVKNQFGKLSEKLVIIPDGPLGYLPFEVLLTESAGEQAIMSTLPYLLRDHAISYSYSVNLWSELSDRKRDFKGKEGVLAFAPSFTRKDEVASNREVVPNNYFTPLQYNQDEAKAINETFGGQMFLGESATLNAFYENMSDFPIIHLASHGKTHDKDSRYSYIAFADPRDTAQKQLLYVSDLYNLHFNADLVVLSACETGLGTLYRGEGITSLARAFTYAGAQSIATTLWQVDDQTSAILMKTFYEFMDQGFSKDEALRQAKLKLIEDQYDPFFWAGYILIGDAEPVRKPERTYLWLLFVMGGVLVVVVLGEWRKRRGGRN